MFCWVQSCAARNTATYGPKPDNAPARNKLTASSPRELVSEGDGSIPTVSSAEFAATTIVFGLRQLVGKAPAMGIVARCWREKCGRPPRGLALPCNPQPHNRPSLFPHQP